MVRTIFWVVTVWTALAVVVSLALGAYFGGRRALPGLRTRSQPVVPDGTADAERIAS